ncbi:hypothetical protein [uncultured Cyclobacterium sp.]|uniref:hypothetical protein n=1 Tax=uncultured Cyclobacterium sp. TaxID=453820 RepID=UPI0030EBB7AE|tara:strand:+ start:24423 stop:24617 length:195 start_codon:yes stop_codon:yes gene_type:complete
MNTEKKYQQFGLKYGIPLAIITATLAMKKSSGLGKLITFSIATPALLGYLYSLIKVKELPESEN